MEFSEKKELALDNFRNNSTINKKVGWKRIYTLLVTHYFSNTEQSIN